MSNELISNITTSTRIMGLSITEGIEAAKTDTQTTTTAQPTRSSNTNYSNPSTFVIQFIEVGLPIIMAIAFYKTVKGRIQRKEKFSGLGWALANGLLGVGVLWIIIAHSSLNKEIAQIKDKRYKKYVQLQMKDFVKVYGVCLLCWVVIFSLFYFT